MALDKISQAVALTGELTEELLARIGLPTGLCVRRQELCARSLHEVAAGVIQDQEYERVMAPLVASVSEKVAARKTRRGGRKAAKRTRRQRQWQPKRR